MLSIVALAADGTHWLLMNNCEGRAGRVMAESERSRGESGTGKRNGREKGTDGENGIRNFTFGGKGKCNGVESEFFFDNIF